MDEFAQTRGADDLFDDDFTPIAEPEIQSLESVPQSSHSKYGQQGERNGPVSRGRGNRTQSSASRPQKQQSISPNLDTHDAHKPNFQEKQQLNTPITTDSTTGQQQASQPTQTKTPTAVRGDRTATGGTPKPKLTEEELSARLAAVKLNNAKRAEAHRLAEADEASFQQREEHASQKGKEEGQVKRIMNMEREKNRLRKLGAQGGREWDEGKEEIDRKDERGSQYRRGAHGGVAYERGRGRRGGTLFDRDGDNLQNGAYTQEAQDRRGGYRGRGRADRGDRGRGRGRGGSIPNNNISQAPPDPVADFPALPAILKTTQSSSSQPPHTPLSPAAGGSSWADEVQAAKAPDAG